MAFTKKAKAAPKAASYVRKSKKREPEVEQDVQEEVESDYEDAPETEGEEQEQEQYQEQEHEQERPRQSRGYSSNNYPQRSSPSPSQGNRPYGARRNTPQGDGKGVRVTGLFAGKREGLWTGRLRKEDIENLMGLFDSALNSNQLVTMFLWENQDGPQFSLTANLAQEFKGGGGGGNRFNRGYRGSIGRR